MLLHEIPNNSKVKVEHNGKIVLATFYHYGYSFGPMTAVKTDDSYYINISQWQEMKKVDDHYEPVGKIKKRYK